MGDPTKMYEALERGVNLFYSFSNVYPGQTVTSVMSSWISQPGHPVVQVNVDRENKQITLNQVFLYYHLFLLMLFIK